ERVLITETRQGYVCANAGVDHSNTGVGVLTLLPTDPDASASRLRARLRQLAGVKVGVIVSDTFGRPWRLGIVNVALGVAGLPAGIQAIAPEHELTVVANTADDDDFWGVRVCPDIDAVIYRLAGIFNHEVGYGVKGDTFHVLDGLSRAGEDTWFRIGDRDFAT